MTDTDPNSADPKSNTPTGIRKEYRPSFYAIVNSSCGGPKIKFKMIYSPSGEYEVKRIPRKPVPRLVLIPGGGIRPSFQAVKGKPTTSDWGFCENCFGIVRFKVCTDDGKKRLECPVCGFPRSELPEGNGNYKIQVYACDGSIRSFSIPKHLAPEPLMVDMLQAYENLTGCSIGWSGADHVAGLVEQLKKLMNGWGIVEIFDGGVA